MGPETTVDRPSVTPPVSPDVGGVVCARLPVTTPTGPRRHRGQGGTTWSDFVYEHTYRTGQQR